MALPGTALSWTRKPSETVLAIAIKVADTLSVGILKPAGAQGYSICKLSASHAEI